MADETADAPQRGVKQRNKIVMSQEEIDEFLQGRHSMTMSTINPDGSIHSIAMWYGFLEGCVGIESKAKAQKVEDPDRMFELGISVFDRYMAPYTEEMRGAVEMMLHKRVVVKLNVERVISWDHRKLNGGY